MPEARRTICGFKGNIGGYRRKNNLFEPAAFWMRYVLLFLRASGVDLEMDINMNLGVDSTFFSAIVLFKNRSPFPQGVWRFRKIRVPRMELAVTPTMKPL